MGSQPFPPPPRSSGELASVAAQRLQGRSQVSFDTVALPGLDAAWVGVRVDDDVLCSLRPWLFDVVGAEFGDHPMIRRDPFALVVPHDVIAAQLWNAEFSHLGVSLAVPVVSVPESVEMLASSLPPEPWCFEWSYGWTTTTLALSLQSWFVRNVGDVAVSGTPDGVQVLPASFLAGDGLFVDADAFDGLLRLGADTAAVATTVFSAFVEALGDHVDTASLG